MRLRFDQNQNFEPQLRDTEKALPNHARGIFSNCAVSFAKQSDVPGFVNLEFYKHLYIYMYGVTTQTNKLNATQC